ncbi:DUF7507 domain-containing protein [Agromyces badenianii]|uniref:DUF7507 domain-containing protein n=1 Tax=Agromyces badenianii TaxID=2080742 RepID=UPI00105984D5|nr:hypothetical protein [Agromyces badenianii]
MTYTYAVANAGNTPLVGVDLTDDTPPCTAPTRGVDLSGNDDDTLDLGETWSYSCVSAGVTGSVLNTATVTGVPIDPTTDAEFPAPNPPVTDSDTAKVGVTNPELSLTKAVDHDVVFPGTTVTYTYAATNDGDADLRNDTGDAGWVADDTCAPVGYSGGDDGDGLLNPGETWSFTCQRTVNTPTLNIATIVAQPVSDGAPVGGVLTRHDIAFVDVASPGIAIAKTALTAVVLDPDAEPIRGPDTPDPRPAEYVYEVSNPGAVPLRDVDPSDDRCAPLALDPAGDVNGDGNLDPSEVWSYTCDTALEREQGTPAPVGAESALVTNTATVSGTPFLPDDPDATGPVQTASDTAQVLVIEPSLAITKSASAPVVRNGDSVTYRFEVRNTGDVGLDFIGPADDKCAPLAYESGDLEPANGILDGANGRNGLETWIYTCTRPIGLPTSPDTTDVNDVSVAGIDPLGNSYEATATAEVAVIDPAIELVKTVSDHLVLAGSEVTYGFDVTNSGLSPVAADDVLADLVLVDGAVPATPSCTRPALVSKSGGNQDDLLDRDPDEVWHYECTAKIDRLTVNVAEVRATAGTTAGLSFPVFAFDMQAVQAFHPGIEIVKTALPTELTAPGGPVVYRYEVRNTGDVPLANVAESIDDDTCAPVAYESGDIDGDGLLDSPRSIFEDASDEVWIFTCSASVTKNTVNTVVVTGTPVDPGGVELCEVVQEPESPQPQRAAVATSCDVEASDTAEVTVVPGRAPPGGMANTGVPYPVLLLLALAGAVMLVGTSLVIRGARRRSSAARSR